MKPQHPIPLLAAATLAALAFSSLAPSASAAYVGVNLAGAEFGSTFPGTYGQNYTYPTTAELDYYKARGLVLIRLPFRWERLQPTLHAPLNAAEYARLDAVIRESEKRGLRVILDMHNYAGYFLNGVNQPLGSPQVPASAFQDVWTRIAASVRGYDCIWGYGLMNEPVFHGSYSWKASAQAAINGIRSQDTTKRILVCGEGWSGAHSWPAINGTMNTLTDPANNLVFEAHQYFDNDSSGTYDQSYDAEGATAQTGVTRLTPFVNWCATNGVAGFIGEIGVPDNDPRWLTALDNAFSYLQTNNIHCTVWAGGPWWGNEPLSTELRASHDEAPQMASMLPYGGGHGTRHWKPFVWYWDAVSPGVQSSYNYNYKSDTALLSASFADAGSAYNTGYNGAAGIRLAYTVPSGGWAGAGMHIHGGVNLAPNFVNGHVLSFYAKGTAGSSVRVFLVTTGSVTSAKVATPALASTWQKISIPLSQFVISGLNGTQRIQRVAFEGLPANNTAQIVNLDAFVIEKPDIAAPAVTVNTSTGGSSFPRDTNITATATASDAGGIHFVEFLVNGVRYAADTSSPYSHTFTLPAAGTYRLVAIAYDNHGNPARSTVKTLTITP